MSFFYFLNLFVDIDECSTKNGGCQHRCQNSHGGFICLCPDGYRLHADGRTCIGKQLVNSYLNNFVPKTTNSYPNLPFRYNEQTTAYHIDQLHITVRFI